MDPNQIKNLSYRTSASIFSASYLTHTDIKSWLVCSTNDSDESSLYDVIPDSHESLPSALEASSDIVDPNDTFKALSDAPSSLPSTSTATDKYLKHASYEIHRVHIYELFTSVLEAFLEELHKQKDVCLNELEWASRALYENSMLASTQLIRESRKAGSSPSPTKSSRGLSASDSSPGDLTSSGFRFSALLSTPGPLSPKASEESPEKLSRTQYWNESHSDPTFGDKKLVHPQTQLNKFIRRVSNQEHNCVLHHSQTVALMDPSTHLGQFVQLYRETFEASVMQIQSSISKCSEDHKACLECNMLLKEAVASASKTKLHDELWLLEQQYLALISQFHFKLCTTTLAVCSSIQNLLQLEFQKTVAMLRVTKQWLGEQAELASNLSQHWTKALADFRGHVKKLIKPTSAIAYASPKMKATSPTMKTKQWSLSQESPSHDNHNLVFASSSSSCSSSNASAMHRRRDSHHLQVCNQSKHHLGTPQIKKMMRKWAKKVKSPRKHPSTDNPSLKRMLCHHHYYPDPVFDVSYDVVSPTESRIAVDFIDKLEKQKMFSARSTTRRSTHRSEFYEDASTSMHTVEKTHRPHASSNLYLSLLPSLSQPHLMTNPAGTYQEAHLSRLKDWITKIRMCRNSHDLNRIKLAFRGIEILPDFLLVHWLIYILLESQMYHRTEDLISPAVKSCLHAQGFLDDHFCPADLPGNDGRQNHRAQKSVDFRGEWIPVEIYVTPQHILYVILAVAKTKLQVICHTPLDALTMTVEESHPSGKYITLTYRRPHDKTAYTFLNHLLPGPSSEVGSEKSGSLRKISLRFSENADHLDWTAFLTEYIMRSNLALAVCPSPASLKKKVLPGTSLFKQLFD